MSDPYLKKLAGHAHRWLFIRDGEWVTGCECGEISPPLVKGTIKEGIEWHRQHKADMIDKFLIQGVDL